MLLFLSDAPTRSYRKALRQNTTTLKYRPPLPTLPLNLIKNQNDCPDNGVISARVVHVSMVVMMGGRRCTTYVHHEIVVRNRVWKNEWIPGVLEHMGASNNYFPFTICQRTSTADLCVSASPNQEIIGRTTHFVSYISCSHRKYPGIMWKSQRNMRTSKHNSWEILGNSWKSW